MIINGGSRKNGGFFAQHLMRADENEQVNVVEVRGLGAENVPDAFREMRAVASGTQCKNYFYHANINARPDEPMTAEQWAEATDLLEHELQLDGQPRFIVEHEKEGRIHRHIIWSRIDADTMTAIPDSHNYWTHELVAAELETRFGQQPTQRALTREDGTERPEPNVKDWESFRAAESKIDPKAMKAELTELWQHSDSGLAFAAALDERGYILAKGDRRDFCVIDAAGDEHSLGRRISGVKAAEIRARMSDVDPSTLPSVAEGRELARQRQEETAGSGSDAMTADQGAAPQEGAGTAADTTLAADTAPLLQPAQEQPGTVISPFDAILAERVKEAEAQMAEAIAGDGGHASRFDRVKAWWSNFREYVTDRRDHYREQWSAYFGDEEPAEDMPSTSPAETPAPSPAPPPTSGPSPDL